MQKYESKLFSERVNLRVVLGALVFVIFGFFCLVFSAQNKWWTGQGIWVPIFQNLGAISLVTVALTFGWELVGKRAFLDEVLAKAQLSRDIKSAGILQITDSFHDKSIDWTSYIKKATNIDIFFAYGKTWRNTYAQELEAVAHKDDAHIKVVLPDPENKETIVELARRFSYEQGDLINLIKEAEEYFENLKPKNGSKGATLEIWFLPAAPTFTFYRFDHVGVLALYTHRKKRTAVPTFICEQGGSLYNYIRQEFEAMTSPKEALARKKCV